MSLDKITARLYSDSERECAELVRKATEDAKHLLLSASEEACALVSAERESAEKDAETIIEKARSAASASERRAVLKAKSELIETVLLSAKKQLLALDDEKYFELLVYLAKKNLRNDKGTLCMSDEDIKRCPADFASRLGGNITVSSVPEKTDGGFILKYGDIEINCTFGALFAAYSDELKAKASEVLFG